MTLGGVLLTAAVLVAVANALPGSVGPAAVERALEHAKRQAPPTAAVYVSPTGNDATCVRGNPSKPCLSFSQAYEIARQGDFVQVAAGDYRGQTIEYDPTKTGARGACRLVYNNSGGFSPSMAGCVTFGAAPGAVVRIGAHTQTTADLNMSTTTTIRVASTSGFYPNNGSQTQVMLGRQTFTCASMDATDFFDCNVTGSHSPLWGWAKGTDVIEDGVNVSGASYLDFKDLSVRGLITVHPDAGGHIPSDVLFDGVTAATSLVTGSNLYFEGSTLGPFNGSRNNRVTDADHVGIVNSTIQGETISGCDGRLSGQDTNYYCHGDGVYVTNSTSLYFVGDTFTGNDIFHIFFSHGHGAVNPGPVTIADSSFGPLGPHPSYYAVSIRGDTNDVLDRYTITGNTSVERWVIGANSSSTNVSLTNWIISGNLFGARMCPTRPGGWSGTFDVTYTYNAEPGRACKSSTGVTADHNAGGVVTPARWGSAIGLHPGAGEAAAAACTAPAWSASARQTALPAVGLPLMDSKGHLLGPCRR